MFLHFSLTEQETTNDGAASSSERERSNETAWGNGSNRQDGSVSKLVFLQCIYAFIYSLKIKKGNLHSTHDVGQLYTPVPINAEHMMSNC